MILLWLRIAGEDQECPVVSHSSGYWSSRRAAFSNNREHRHSRIHRVMTKASAAATGMRTGQNSDHFSSFSPIKTCRVAVNVIWYLPGPRKECFLASSKAGIRPDRDGPASRNA